jgi:putative PIG3 family NAD(P)H quinone oxidoreductase
MEARGPAPEARDGEILVRVRAAGVNRPDVLQRQGFYSPPPGASEIPGLEVAGEVIATGSGVERWRIGDRVCALVSGGGYAEYVNVPWRQALPIPRGLSMEEAAGLPEVAFTVWSNVVERGRLAAGEVLLVHGGSSGIGTMAIQLGRALGARVIATAGSPEKCLACVELGAERCVDYRSEDFVAAVREMTGGRGADVILDMVGGDYIQRNMQCAAEDGRIVQIAFLQGSAVSLNLMPVMLKRLSFTGSTLRARPEAFKAALARAVEQNVWPMIESGRIKVVVAARFALSEAAQAHRLMESSTHIGKILLIP